MSSPRGWPAVLLAIVPVVVALGVGQWATFPNLVPWYAGLVKPSFNPPNWIFGPVWSALYALMALSLWRLLTSEALAAGKRLAIGLFFLQLILNALWSVLFFGLHSPLAGLVDIVPQWLAILATIAVARRIDGLAAACLVPLAVWVAFAGVLNFAIWRLNG